VNTWLHSRFIGGVRVAHLFSFLCCPMMCLYVLSSVLWCPLRFPHKHDVRFVFISSCLYGVGVGVMSYLRYMCLCIVVSNTYCVVFCFVFDRVVYLMLSVSLDCPFWLPLRYSESNVYLLTFYESFTLFQLLFLKELFWRFIFSWTEFAFEITVYLDY
jgi:hypothetical protein